MDARIGLLPTSSRAVGGTEADLILVLPGEIEIEGVGNMEGKVCQHEIVTH